MSNQRDPEQSEAGARQRDCLDRIGQTTFRLKIFLELSTTVSAGSSLTSSLRAEVVFALRAHQKFPSSFQKIYFIKGW
jgi:hypothetical protein